MPKTNIAVGLDLGTTKICVGVAEIPADPDEEPRLLCIGQAESHGIRKGEIVDFDAARDAVREAVADAESKSDLQIESAYVGISGGHLGCVNNRASIDLPRGREVVTAEDIEAVKLRGLEVSIPEANYILHPLVRGYRLDGREVLDPVEMPGRRLEAEYHLIHGVFTRGQNVVRLVKDVPLELDEAVAAPLAAAMGSLDEAQRERGVLLIDIGGGTTDYIVYRDGTVCHSGCLAVGGDHVTHDLSLGLHIPVARAERLKLDEGNAVLGVCRPDELIHLRAEPGFAAREIEREMLHQIVHMRLREVFELLRDAIGVERHLPHLGAGVVLTGGASQTPGIQHLAAEVFGLPVSPANPPPFSGLTHATDHPQLSTVLGLIEYARVTAGSRPPTGVFARMKAALGRMFTR